MVRRRMLIALIVLIALVVFVWHPIAFYFMWWPFEVWDD